MNNVILELVIDQLFILSKLKRLIIHHFYK